MSETGIQALPSLDTWRESTKNLSDLQYGSDFVQHREHSGGQINHLRYVNYCFSYFYQKKCFVSVKGPS